MLEFELLAPDLYLLKTPFAALWSGVFLLRPAMAPTDLFPGLAVENGSVTVDRRMRTNLEGLFAAGDCTGGPLQVSKAVGEGLIAGQSAAAYAAELLRRARNGTAT